MSANIRKWLAFAVPTVALVAALLAAWQAAAADGSSTLFFFSSPTAVSSALWDGLRSGEAWNDLLASATETLGALSVGIIVGGMAGSLALIVRPLRPLVAGLTAVLAALPILALAPMFLIWFGVGASLKVALGALLCGLVATAQVLAAEKVLTRDLREFMQANHVEGSVALRKIILPLATPAALQRFPDAVNAAFLGVFVGEFVAADRGIGFRILRSGSLYAVDQVLAYTVLALVLLLGLQLAVAAIRALVTALVQRGSIAAAVRGAGS